MSYMSSQTRTPAMLDAARSGAGGTGFKGPSNIQFMLTRMTAFSKNTIRLQPQTKSTYNPQDTITFRLPASALLDMASCTLKFDFVTVDKAAADGSDKWGGTKNAANPPVGPGTEVIAAPPKATSGFFRRMDVAMGATSVGLTGLHGMLHCIEATKMFSSSCVICYLDMGVFLQTMGACPPFCTTTPSRPTMPGRMVTGWNTKATCSTRITPTMPTASLPTHSLPHPGRARTVSPSA